jgi:hypothetical protein
MRTPAGSAMVALLEREFVMTFKSLDSWFSAPLMAFFLTFMPMFATVHGAPTGHWHRLAGRAGNLEEV